eukprot:TRINITY_DN8392_c0_g1_i2.p2 TRINITY_DN8392_c0_g1~~TRINITY_DN8392_c0_g1_i2.p2  ORF type:complete len:227 (-),score=38.71 TRINITY_DN8392_c0_g1_i2:71-751(-)
MLWGPAGPNGTDQRLTGDPRLNRGFFQCQRLAVNDARENGCKITNSTPEAPPKVTPPDVTALCALKRQAIAKHSTPQPCAHCGKFIEPKWVVEVKRDVIAYCKAKDGCAHSHILFVQPSLDVPEYEKVCAYEPEDVDEAQAPAPYCMPMQSLYYPPVVFRKRNGDGPLEAVSSDVSPAHLCKKCHKCAEDHKGGYDQNGWRECGRVEVELPSDWPRWNGAGWSNMD